MSILKSFRRIAALTLILAIILPTFSALNQIEPVQATPTAPTSEEIDESVKYAYEALARLYMGDDFIDDDMSIMAEYFGLPVAVKYNGWSYTPTGKRVLLGWIKPQVYASIDHVTSNATYEEYILHFTDPRDDDEDQPKIRAFIDWNYSSTHIRVGLKNEGIAKATGGVYVYLRQLQVCTMKEANIGTTWVTDIEKSTAETYLRSFRYTIRHGSQMGYKTFRGAGCTEQEWQLANYALNEMGFTFDIYDPTFHYGDNKSIDYCYFDEAFYDVECFDDLSIGTHWYPYKSKVITIGLSGYLYAQKTEDILHTTLQCIQVLHTTRDPDYSFLPNDEWGEGNITARSFARDYLEKHVDADGWWNGEGVRYVTGNTSYCSTIRTAAMLILETMLGYEHNDATSRLYADTIADKFMDIQVPQDGVFDTVEFNEVYRPLYRGTYFIGYDPAKWLSPRSLIDVICDLFHIGMPKEYAGIIPSNAETTMLVCRALITYQEYKYGKYVGDSLANPGAPTSNEADPVDIMAEQDYYDTGWTIHYKNVSFPTTSTYTIYVLGRQFDDHYGRYVELWIDDSRKLYQTTGTGFTKSWTGEVSAGYHCIGVTLTTYKEGKVTDPWECWWLVTCYDPESLNLPFGSDHGPRPGSMRKGLQDMGQLTPEQLARNATGQAIFGPEDDTPQSYYEDYE